MADGSSDISGIKRKAARAARQRQSRATQTISPSPTPPSLYPPSDDSRTRLSNTLEDMLEDRSDPTRPSEFRPKSRQSAWLFVAIATVSGVLGVLGLLFGNESNILGPFFWLALGVVPLCLWLSGRALEHNDKQHELDVIVLEHLTDLERDHLRQRNVALTAIKDVEMLTIEQKYTRDLTDMELSTRRYESDNHVKIAEARARAEVEASKYQAMAVTNDREFDAALLRLQHMLTSIESEKERDWKAQEAAEDRKHDMEKLLERLDHELEMWKEKIQVEYRGEPERMQEELDAWELERMAREAIDQEMDEDKKLRYIKAFEKRMHRRSA